jgi:serpin B
MKTARMNILLTAAAVAGLTAGLLAGCGAARPARSGHVERAKKPAVLTTSQVTTLRALSSGDTAFGLGLLSAVCHAGQGQNVVLSPLSVTSGLGLAYLGAKGRTAAEMAAVMHLPGGTPSALNAELRDRNELLGTLDRPGVTFSQTNRIWADPKLITKPSYVAALHSAYQTTLTHVPLLTDPAQATRTINAAVARATRGHIPHLLPAGAIDGSIGWVLTNALYLKAAWATPFNAALTQPGPFSASGGQVTVKYLNGEDYKIASDGGWTAAALPYRGQRLQMIALLPPRAAGNCPLPSSTGLAAIEKDLQSSQQTASISLPKVNLSWSGSLKSELIALGMRTAFSGNADFSGISPQACCIGFVQHAATLDVAEKGTVASAATAVGVGVSAALAKMVKFNRPYLMMIEDTKTGEPLMYAWVSNPAAS